MSEAKDPAIKLFGRTIKLPEYPSETADLVDSGRSTDAIVQDSSCSPSSLAKGRNLNTGGAEQDSEKDPLEGRNEDSTEEDEHVMSNEVNDSNGMNEEDEHVMSNEVNDLNGMKENSKALSVDDMSASRKAEEEQNESSESQDKMPKKPDKILPCPRCNSMDTKFCYYNNYNVNQPRHFCKNCHRYWTAGGTMRNVPVGAGRRKNKSSASQCYLPSGIHSSLKPSDSSLASCSETPLCESTASFRNIPDKAVRDITMNGFHGPDGHRISGPYGSTGNAENHSGGSSTTKGSSKDETGNDRFAVDLVPDNRTIPHQMACFPGAPWPYPWNTIQLNTHVPPAAYTSAGFSVPYYSAATYWACTMPGAWNIPWLNSLPASQNDPNPLSGPSSSTLGKRSRDDSLMKLASSEKDEPLKENNPEKNLWVPKTLRIVDPEEAAKSSIWSTLGIRNNKVDPAVGGGLFKAFQSKGGAKTKILEASPLLQANPAAMSRSLTFQESSRV